MINITVHSTRSSVHICCEARMVLLLLCRPATYVWVNATDGLSSHLKVFQVQVNQQISLKELATHSLTSCAAR